MRVLKSHSALGAFAPAASRRDVSGSKERRLLTACANMPPVGILVLLTSDAWNSDVGTFFPSRFSCCALRALIQGFSLPTSALRFGASCLRNFLCEGLTHGEVLSKHVIPIDADVVVQP